MKLKQEYFKNTGKEKNVFLFSLCKNDIEIKITNYGAAVTSIKYVDRKGNLEEIITGFDNLEDYEKGHPYFGVICGRYANRIAKGSFNIDGITYQLAINNYPNALHGGIKGFDKVIWHAETIENTDEIGVKLTYLSLDMEEGYPGNLQTEVIYLLNNQNELTIQYTASTDKPTIINLTNHCYFNLAGCDKPIYDLELFINADNITEFDNTNIPTGRLISVENTAFDFRTPRKIKDKIHLLPNGFDHNYVLNKKYSNEFSFGASLYDASSGRKMNVYTTEPGIQFYSANYLDGTIKGHKGIKYAKHCSLCLETQHFPDSPNHPHFPSTILRPGEKYFQRTVYAFKIE